MLQLVKKSNFSSATDYANASVKQMQKILIGVVIVLVIMTLYHLIANGMSFSLLLSVLLLAGTGALTYKLPELRTAAETESWNKWKNEQQQQPREVPMVTTPQPQRVETVEVEPPTTAPEALPQVTV